MSKGSSPRPFAVSNEEYQNRWDAIFGKDNDQKKNEEKALESFGSNSSCGGGSSDHTQTDAGQTKVS